MREYKRTIDIDPDSQYWYVDMGPLNQLNGPATYPFPTEEAAWKFALAHKRLAVWRQIQVVSPVGYRRSVNLFDEGT